MKTLVLLVVSTLSLSAGCDWSASTDLEPDPAKGKPTPKASSEGEPTSTSSAAARAASPSAAASPNRNALFLRLFRDQLPADLCKPEQYFRACFQVTEARCKEVVAEELNKCVATHAATLPVVRDGTTGAAAGRVLGQCTGTAYDIRLLAKRIQSSRCNDPTNWVGK
jgi:hypothetical protein